MSSSVRPGRAKVVRSTPSISQSSFKPTIATTASASFASSTACSSNLSESWISAPPRWTTPEVLTWFQSAKKKEKEKKDLQRNKCTYSWQIHPRRQLDQEHCSTQQESHVWCPLSTGMCFSFPKLDRRMRARVVDGTNYRSPTDHLRRAIKSGGKSSEAVFIYECNMNMYLCSPTNFQSKFESAIIWSRSQVPSQFKRPVPCDPLRCRYADEQPRFINKFRFQDFILRYKALVVHMTMPTAYPTTFTWRSENIVVEGRQWFVRYGENKKMMFRD